MVFNNYVPVYETEDGRDVVLSVLYAEVPEEDDLARKAKFIAFDSRGVILTRTLDVNKKEILQSGCLFRTIVEEEINCLFPDLNNEQVSGYADKLLGGLKTVEDGRR